MFLSIIIPTINEKENILNLINRLQQASYIKKEIIVCDGGSTDDTESIVKSMGGIFLKSPKKGRAFQLNYGASKAKGDVLYFVHADTLPPISYINDIMNSINEGFPLGCYRFLFNSPKKILKVNAYFTRFDRLMCRGGDQSLFITKQVFDEINGYCEKHQIMEDYDIIIRARNKYPFKIIAKDIIVSARKYDYNSYLKVNIANLIAFGLYFAKVEHQKIISIYRKLLNHPENEMKY